MHIAVSSDEYTELVGFILAELERRGHTVTYWGPAASQPASPMTDWPLVTAQAARQVANRQADEAVVMCWTGTGAALAANKVAGIRAALVHDAPTARGARQWNHANVLALSLRATPIPIAGEILEAWFDTPYSGDEWNQRQIARIQELEAHFRPADPPPDLSSLSQEPDA